MKKAKIMLASIAVVAVVGGSLAFKSAKSHTLTVFTTGTDATKCNSAFAIANATLTASTVGVEVDGYATTNTVVIESGASCGTIYTTVQTN
jgi:hypothetical protein